MTTFRKRQAALLCLCLCLTQPGAVWNASGSRPPRSDRTPDAIGRDRAPAPSWSAAALPALDDNDDDAQKGVDGHPQVADVPPAIRSEAGPRASALPARRGASSLLLLAPKQGPPPFPRRS